MSAASETHSRMSRARVLLIEKDPPLRRSIRLVLESLPLEPFEVADIDQAIESQAKDPFDLVLLVEHSPSSEGGQKRMKSLARAVGAEGMLVAVDEIEPNARAFAKVLGCGLCGMPWDDENFATRVFQYIQRRKPKPEKTP